MSARPEQGLRPGVIYPQADVMEPAAAIELARAAEAAGLDHMLCYERQLGINPNVHPAFESPWGMHAPFHEPLVLFALLAGHTTRLEFATDVLVSPTRQTVVLAKQAASLAIVSNNRFRLGIGVGSNTAAYSQVGADFHHRGARQEEQIRVLRALWSEPEVAFEGRFYGLHGVGISPRPSRPVPIWLGGDSERTIDRVARLGDGWFPYGVPDAANVARIKRLRAIAQEHGRDPATIGIQATVAASEGWAAITERAAAWQAAGATHFALNTMGLGPEPAAHIEAWQRYAAELGAPARSGSQQ